jgi:hypothetical protein
MDEFGCNLGFGFLSLGSGAKWLKGSRAQRLNDIEFL